MDLNIENYSLVELMVILNLSNDPDHKEVREKSQEMVDKFTKENKLVLADFFMKARDQILEYLDSMDQFEESYKLILEQQIAEGQCALGTENSVFDEEKLIIKPTECKLNINQQYTNTIKRTIVVNSEYINTENKTDFTLDLSVPITDIYSISLFSYHVPYSWYNIDESYGTNVFYITTSSETNKSIVLESGAYTMEKLIIAINDKLQDYDSSCTYSEINGKSTISFDESIKAIRFYYESNTEGLRQNYHLGYMLGFRKNEYLKLDSSSSWNIKSEASGNINGTQYLQLMLDDFNKNRLNTNIINMIDNTSATLSTPHNFNFTIERNAADEVIETVPRTLTHNQIYSMNTIESDRSQNNTYLKTRNINSSDMFAILPTKHHGKKLGDMCVDYFDNQNTNKRTYFGPTSLSRIHAKLLDDKGNVVNLNGNDWSFTLVCESLYQGTEKK